MILLPVCKRIDGKTIGDQIIGIRPGESYKDLVQRFLLEKRKKKIEKLMKK